MGSERLRAHVREFWALVARQHGVISRTQLLQLGFSDSAIKRRLANGRLHRVRPGVYAVGRPALTKEGEWIAATLAAGPQSLLAGEAAASLWRMGDRRTAPIELVVPQHVARRVAGVRVRRTRLTIADRDVRQGIPVTSPARTLLDLAHTRSRDRLEAAINEADKRDLIDPEQLRVAAGTFSGLPGAPQLRETLDRHTFVLTDSALERRFLPIARRAGLPSPDRRRVNGFRVDFFWDEVGLVVETDGLRYHRTPAQQARDLRRDQTHSAAGLVPLRFSHGQVIYEAAWIETTLRQTLRSIRAR